MEAHGRITKLLEAGVKEQIFPGAVALVKVRGVTRYHAAVGLASLVPSQHPADPTTLYDLASLTKPLATTSALLTLVEEKRLHLDQSVESLLHPCAGAPVGQVTIRDLLSHRSGLPAWRPYYQRMTCSDHPFPNKEEENRTKSQYLAWIIQEPLEYPCGTQCLYSDLGFILLGLIIEHLTQQSLADYCQQRLFGPLGADPLLFPTQQHPSLKTRFAPQDIAPTEQDPWRQRLLHGEVDDANAYALGSVAGHAGLFGTAAAVAVMTGAWLNGWLRRNAGFDRALVQEFVTRSQKESVGSWALGWDTPSMPSSSGTRLSSKAFGHLGFTGTSIWIDPVQELEMILLTNRVHPSRENTKIRPFRPLFHDVVFEEVIGKR